MNTNLSKRDLRWFAPMLFATGCFAEPSPDVTKLICQGDQQCPVGYSCKVKNVPGGCCKDGQQGCGVVTDAAISDVSPVDVRAAVETSPDHGNVDSPPGIDQATGGTGDASASGGAGGSGGATASGGAGASGGGNTSTVFQPDGSVQDSASQPPDGLLVTVPDAPQVDVSRDVPPVDVPGICSTDQDCPSQAPLCLGNKCAKCANDNDCIGRTGLACDTSGACKGKQKQTCQTAADCANGLPCADGYCCDNACGGSCQACDVAGSLGTCTTLAPNATPHKGHTPCAGSDPTCASKCNGTSACSSPAPGTTCGSASCTGKSFQATGVCGNGACGLPVAQTCGGACVASLGCVDCSPSTKQCSSSGVPQLCSTNGTWQNLNGCQNGNTCLAGDCQCSSPRTTCSNVCIDTTSDTSNCGGCSHLCLGGTCLSGACQAAVTVASTGSSGATLIGVDSSSVYYAVPDPTGYISYAYASGKTSTVNSGAEIDSVGAPFYLGLIGSQLFFGDHYNTYMCTFSSAATTQCNTLATTVPGTGLGNGILVNFKNTQQQYYVTNDTYTATYPTFTWYWISNNTEAQSFGDSISAPSWSDITPFSFDDAVYWLRALYDGSGTVTEVKLYAASVSKPTLTALSDNMAVDTYRVVDANTVSVLLAGPGGIYRVALPGNAATAPPLLASLGSSSLVGATEDAGGVYWMQSDGTLFKCTAATCSTSKKSLATGQTPIGDLYQDATALYWSNGNQIMRIAK